MAPANTRFARIMVINHSSNTGGTAMLIGHMMLRRMRGAELIIDGSLTADHIAANTISASKLVLNGVTRDRIAPGAVTVVKSVYTSGATADVNGASAVAASLAIAQTANADAVEIQFNCKVNQSQAFYQNATSASSNTTVTSKRGSTTIATRTITDGIYGVAGG